MSCLVESDGFVTVDGLAVSAADYEPFCVAAAGFLYGAAMIVGCGRAVALRAALLNPQVLSLDVIDAHREIAERYAGGLLAETIPVRIVVTDAADLALEDRYDSVFYDAWPPTERARRGLERAIRAVKPGGRLVYWSGGYPGVSGPIRFHPEQEIRPAKPAENTLPLIVGHRER